MTQISAQGYDVVFHVHDEMILDVPKEDTRAAELVDKIMAEPIDWAEGLPLKGGTYECEFYRKD
jgi:DNA polymerase